MNSVADNQSGPLRLDRGETFVVAASALANILLWKILYSTGPFSIFLPMVQTARDGDAFPGDAIHGAISHYGTFFYRIIGWLHVPDGALPVIFIGGLFVVLAVSYTLLYLIAREITGDTWVSSLALMAYALRPRLHFGGSYIGHAFTHGTFALAILLVGALLIMRERERLAFLLVGIAANFHAIYAALFGAALAAMLVVRMRRIGLKRVILAPAVSIAAAMPIIIWVLREPSAQGDVAAWLETVRIRSGKDLFFSMQPLLNYLRFGLFCIGIIIGLLVAVRARYRAELTAAFSVLALFFISGIIFVEIFPVKAFIRMQLIRASFVGFIFGVPVTLSAMAWIVRKIRFIRLCAGWHTLARSSRIVLLASGPAGAMTYTAWYFAAKSGTADFPQIVVILRFCIIVVLLGAVVILAGWKFRPRFPRGEGGIYIVLLAATLLLGVGKTALHGLIVRPDAGVYAIGKWSRIMTSLDAVFIVPPNMEGFRFASHRSVYATWTDGTLANFDLEYALLWNNRLKRLHSLDADEKKRAASYSGLSKEEILAVAKESGAAYVVLPAGAGAVFERIVFEDNEYRVYQISVSDMRDSNDRK
ncbi:MAG: DUF6798 domain-containing protein [Planctomycetota bacterium]|jgi:hypothetical protein